MTSSTPPRMMVVKKEDKETKFKALLENVLANAAPGLEVCLVVQGPASPAALALAAIAPALATAGANFRIVVAKPDGRAILPSSFAASSRVLADARCHDAHEMLVAGRCAWIGDSMRRNPAATDSFELHAARDEATASTVANTFERLWRIAVTASETEHASAPASPLALAARLAALGAEPGSTVTAATRH